jgi:hypothetical protein
MRYPIRIEDRFMTAPVMLCAHDTRCLQNPCESIGFRMDFELSSVPGTTVDGRFVPRTHCQVSRHYLFRIRDYLAVRYFDVLPAEQEGVNRPRPRSNHGQGTAEDCQDDGQPHVAAT